MRWRFVDRITRVIPWQSAEGRKTVSLEEYSLLEPFDRKGCLPETILIESCVHLARWLVISSSGFEQTALLTEVRAFSFPGSTLPGSSLTLHLATEDRQADRLSMAVTVTDSSSPIAQGRMTVTIEPLHGLANTADMRAMWMELYGKA